jgi:hypothetical protein
MSKCILQEQYIINGCKVIHLKKNANPQKMFLYPKHFVCVENGGQES